MNSKMITQSQLITTTRKTTTCKPSKQLEQEQIQSNRHHMEGFQWGGGGEE